MAVVIGPAVPPAIHVMTWNIRRQMPAVVARRVDHWEARKPAITALLTAEQPTVIGFQEVLPGQA
ncbi:endonuclease/exonuclease/phosphatase family protein [uncultured Corynebacterium sp.]|uniref:endonuclease/exonuclease/phosphatase family protein n=1 Tax=uncultured Corynebacterium sp. TaxID=159447 RepID=UPI0025D2D9B1|nr:endonuclease/exonuclease/phosphatase family protein [uncultured Corynebacterium sp.]